ncbi:HNH endonuclease, partial [Leisingera sp. McT4-56]|uniref:HNH endonuclease n=1 Tax=Leisingera sp. McT4-56 TaxID=2881255 RepID=UPI001CF8AB1B
MSKAKLFIAMDRHQEWYADLIANHYEAACEKVKELIDSAKEDENGCLVTPTVLPRKVRFRGQQDRAYRFIYCITLRFAATRDQVIRHRCHNRRCVNPCHLIEGTAEDNRR